MTTVALWCRASDAASMDLLGKPVWQRTLEATRGLGSRRVVWLGRPPANPPDGIERVELRDFPRLRGTVLLIPAELPCLRATSLRQLLQRSRRGPRTLVGSEGGRHAALAAGARDWKKALDGLGRLRLDHIARRLGAEPVFPEDAEEVLRVDSAEAWSRAARALRRRKIHALMGQGVLVPDPESVLVDPDVAVGAGTILHPWVIVEGDCRIGKNCSIGSFSHLQDVSVGSGTILLDHCFVRSSRIGTNAQIGPFAHLRPGSDVGGRAKVGNFVELKNARLGEGAKAPHLTYLGDATVGKDANIGAGTITCNYDGKRKHRTVVGDDAFIGSDVQLVAPVRVGKGAYVAAGSCIVEDVPPHALALARSRQIVKKGWAKKRTADHGKKAGKKGS